MIQGSLVYYHSLFNANVTFYLLLYLEKRFHFIWYQFWYKYKETIYLIEKVIVDHTLVR